MVVFVGDLGPDGMSGSGDLAPDGMTGAGDSLLHCMSPVAALCEHL